MSVLYNAHYRHEYQVGYPQEVPWGIARYAGRLEQKYSREKIV